MLVSTLMVGRGAYSRMADCIFGLIERAIKASGPFAQMLRQKLRQKIYQKSLDNGPIYAPNLKNWDADGGGVKLFTPELSLC